MHVKKRLSGVSNFDALCYIYLFSFLNHRGKKQFLIQSNYQMFNQTKILTFQNYYDFSTGFDLASTDVFFSPN